MTEPLAIRAEKVRKTFRRGHFTLDIDELDVPAGTTLALLGPSGSGKSTLLAILGLLEKPDSGRVLLDGREVSVRDHDARLKMAAVFQRPFLMKDTVAANVAYGLRLRRAPASSRRDSVTRALERVGLAGYEDRAAPTLSGGEAHRVSLARALVLEPRVLLLDEPLANLDPLLKRRLTLDFARILGEEGVTTVYVTHDQDEAMVAADRIAIMREGSVAAVGPTDQVTGVPADEWTATFLGVEPPIAGVVTACEEGLATVNCDGIDVFSVCGGVSVGDRVLVGIRPEDVVLVAGGEHVPVSSARNHLAGVVEELAPRGATWHVSLRVGSARIAAMVSRASVTEMELEPGSEVTAVFKATAIRLRLAEEGR